MKSFFIVMVLLYVIPSFAAKYPCPKEIKAKQTLSSVKKNWQSWNDPQAVHILKAIDFYSNHPKQMAQLAPDNKDVPDQDPFWTFVPKDEIWQVCLYQDTSVRLIKKLGKSLKRCEVKYNKTTKPQIDSVDCV